MEGDFFMRRSQWVVPFVVLAAACVSLAALFVFPGVSSAGSPSQGSPSQDSPSQGSIARGPGIPEEDFPDYSQVVDNLSERFDAPGWKSGDSGLDFYGENYSVPGEGTKPARFKVKIPATGVYSVYSWWHAEGGNDTSARFGVSTPSGVEWTEVNQRKDGGFWVKIGQYEMKKGDSYAVQVAPGSGEEGPAVADAVAIVRGVTSAPPDESYDGGSSGLRTSADRGSGPNGRDAVRRARTFQGTRYKYATCTRTRMSCTCLTGKSYGKFGIDMSMSEGKQWSSNRGYKIRYKRNLRRGDHVFFREHGRRGRITHVGVYSGNGNIVHASSYFGKVVESKMRYINGFTGAKRYKRLN